MIKSYIEYKYYLERDRVSSDIQENNSLKGFLKDFLCPNECWKFIKALRYLEYCHNVKRRGLGWVLWVIAKHRYRKISIQLGFSIPINVFGPGLSLPHRGNIIVNPDARIGENCRIHVGVNIGSHRGMSPIIGDNVYIGPGAIIFGDIRIVNNVSIGANATVNKSVLSENVVVAGTPARIVKTGVATWNNAKNI